MTSFPLDKSPYTEKIYKNIELFTSEPLMFPEDNLEDALCEPGHEFIQWITSVLFWYGSRGINASSISGDKQDVIFEALIRGCTTVDVFTFLLTFIGKFVTYLWVVRSWFSDGYREDLQHIHKRRLGVDVSATGERILVPMPNSLDIVLEWWWASRFWGMATSLEEQDLNLIPFYKLPMKGVKIEKTAEWLAEREKLKAEYGRFPYTLMMDGPVGQPFIMATAVQSEDFKAVMDGTLAYLASLEYELSSLVGGVSKMWGELLNIESLKDRHINERYHNLMLTQIRLWADQMRNDSTLMASIFGRSMSQDWSKPAEKKRMEQLRDAIDRSQKEFFGYGRGYRSGRPEMEIDQCAKDEIEMMLPELKVFIREFAWPVKNQEKQEKKAQEHEWKHLSPRDWDFVWRQYGERDDRQGFCSAVVQKYLERTTSHPYGIDPIKDYLKPFMKTIPRKKSKASPYFSKR